MTYNYQGSGYVFCKAEKYECDLYLDNDSDDILICINVPYPNINGTYLQFDIDILNIINHNGFKYALINCHRVSKTIKISESKTVYEYVADYMICGVNYDDREKVRFNSVEYQMLNIIEWGEKSGYQLDKSFELRLSESGELTIYDDEDVSIRYRIQCTGLPCTDNQLLREKIVLEQNPIITIELKKTESDLFFFSDIFLKLKRLIELSSIDKVYANKMTAYSNSMTQSIGNFTYPIPIEIKRYHDKGKETKIDNSIRRRIKIITLPELLQHDAFNHYFQKHDKLKPIIDDYIEILYSKNISNVRVFLNIVQALETYHSRFITNKVGEFKKRIDNDVLYNDSLKSNFRAFLLTTTTKSITLESRLADLLLAEFKIRFDTGEIEPFDFPHVIAKTRNYYIHYNEEIKKSHRVLSDDELAIYNRTLMSMLEYYLLKELGFDDAPKIRQKLTERWGKISDYFSIKRTLDQQQGDD